MRLAERLTDSAPRFEFEGELVGHLIAEDLNRPDWADTFREWLGDGGNCALSDPNVPTFCRGPTALDRFLFQPGLHIPPSLLPVEASFPTALDHHYAAVTANKVCIGEHCREIVPPPTTLRKI